VYSIFVYAILLTKFLLFPVSVWWFHRSWCIWYNSNEAQRGWKKLHLSWMISLPESLLDIWCLVNMMLHNLNFEYRYTQRTGSIHLDNRKISRGRLLCTYPRTEMPNLEGKLKFTTIQNLKYVKRSRWHTNCPFFQIPLDSYLPTWRGNVIQARLEVNPARIMGMSLCKCRRWCSWC
jgi:hypothetical protein